MGCTQGGGEGSSGGQGGNGSAVAEVSAAVSAEATKEARPPAVVSVDAQRRWTSSSSGTCAKAPREGPTGSRLRGYEGAFGASIAPIGPVRAQRRRQQATFVGVNRGGLPWGEHASVLDS